MGGKKEEKGFSLISSNKLEFLVNALSRIMKKPLDDPFIPECVVIQSRGMSRYISLETARLNGICANMDYLFPNGFISKYLESFTDYRTGQTQTSVYEPENLCYKVFACFPAFLESHAFPELSGYIRGEEGQLKRFQLAQRIADLFDQYLLFRPDMIKAWEKGGGNDWQAHLWRFLRTGTSGGHRVDLYSTFLEEVRHNRVPLNHFPERIFIFGISALPSYYMDVFYDVSRFSQVHFFLLNPCSEYWGDVLSEKERSRASRKSGGSDRGDLYLTRGNRLLGSLGKIGRDFFDSLQKYDNQDIPLFHTEDNGTLLSAVQNDIFYFRDPGDADYEKRTVKVDDTSLQIHSCHSAMREVEVLYDRVYRMFELDSFLKPRDILVMMTDCETYAPLVHSVFGRKPENRDPIPYSVADRGLARENPVVSAFLDLLGMKNGRFAVSDVFGLLEEEKVRQAFSIGEDDLDVLSLWVREANIRWGWDEKHRQQSNLPGFDDCSWMWGLKRLLLGYAMPGKDALLYKGILPYDNIEGKQAELLGSFMEYLTALYSWVSELHNPKTPEEWTRHLLDGVGTFFRRDDQSERELSVLKDQIVLFKERSVAADLTEKIDYSVIHHDLAKKLDSVSEGFGFITGGVTFCAMLPMRSIPFKVICVLGMNSNDYPRQGQTPGFDLMVKNPRPGDRSRRNDDRYLFLEALISARNTFYISYTGRSERDNTAMEPSVLVSELTDYIEAGFVNGVKVIEHPLQPFSSRYFENPVKTNGKDGEPVFPDLFSYSKDNYRAALAGSLPPPEETPFFNGELEPPGPDFLETDVSQFCRFFRNPAQFLLENRLKLSVPESKTRDDDSEPFDIKGLDRYALESRLVDLMLDNRERHDLYTWARATGRLPLGRKGEILFNTLKKEVKELVQGVSRETTGHDKRSEVVDVALNGVRIAGAVGPVYDDRLVQFRPSRIGGNDVTGLWVRHLVLSISRDDPDPFSSFLFGLDRTREDNPLSCVRFGVVKDARRILSDLTALYLEGLQKPLHFFPAASFAYYDSCFKGNDRGKALDAAVKVWEGNDFSPVRESGNPYYQICFRNQNPLDSAFAEISERVFSPIFRHMEKIS